MKYLHNPSQAHIKGGKRILRYLAGSKYLAIKFEKGNGERQSLHGYSDANFANYDMPGYRSHSGWVFFLSGGLLSSSSKLQNTVALSTTECELYGLCMATIEAV